MNIKSKLLVQFSLFVFIILLLFSAAILYFSSSYREKDYYSRLENRGISAAKLLLSVDEISKEILTIIDKNTYSLLNENLRIFDDGGRLIYASVRDSTYELDINLIHRASQKREIRFKEGEREGLAIVFQYEQHNYVVVVSAIDKYGLSKIVNLKIVLGVGFLFSVFTSVLFGYFFAGRALSPISNVIRQVKMITINNLNQRVNEGNKKDEIAQLAITFNQMLQRIEDAFILQREFVANAAHELRTPFTVLVAELDYILLKERDVAQYKLVIRSILDEIKKLSKLSNGLLDLARVSFEKSPMDFSPIRIDELLIETRNGLSKLKPNYEINLTLEDLPEMENQITVLGNEQLLSISFSNLMDNACKFSDGHKVSIQLKFDREFISICFKDDGVGIHHSDLDKIFHPFYRGQNSHFIAGHGIGLALTKKIIELHSGSVSVHSELGKGSIFEILLPVKGETSPA